MSAFDGLGITKGVSLDKLRVALKRSRSFTRRSTRPSPATISRSASPISTARIVSKTAKACDERADRRTVRSIDMGHLRLLWLYVTQGRPDVHSGYFAPGFVGS